jgi:hypothetical protein
MSDVQSNGTLFAEPTAERNPIGSPNPMGKGVTRWVKASLSPDARARSAGRGPARALHARPPLPQWPLRRSRWEDPPGCRLHGGMTLRSPASGRWKHGRYSKYLPKGLTEAHQRAEADLDLLSLRSDVALLEALEVQVLETMQESDAATAWEMGRDELKDLIAHKTRTAVAEHKRLRDLSCVLTAEQAGAFVGALIAAARETVMPVSEKAYRQLMQRTCQLLPGRPANVQAQEGVR